MQTKNVPWRQLTATPNTKAATLAPYSGGKNTDPVAFGASLTSNRNRKYSGLRASRTRTAMPVPTPPPSSLSTYKREKSLGPPEIDYSGLMSDPLGIRAVEDLEALIGQQVEITDFRHADWSTKGVQIRNRHFTQISIKRHGLTEVPDSIRNLKYLEWLSFEGNKLTSLPDVFAELPKLRDINLVDNPLASLPSSLQHMTRLIRVQLEKKKGRYSR